MPNQRLALLALAAGAITLAACDDARTLEAREGSSAERCSVCHGFPPPAPHPQSQSCFACHPQTVDRDNELIPGGAHGNGRVDQSFGHPQGYAAVHSGDAIRDIQICSECHGPDYGGGLAGVSCNACHGLLGFPSWQSNCTFCHGERNPAATLDDLAQAAPPQGVREGTAPTDPQVGAHQRHLGPASTVTNGFACQTCHPLNGSLAHLDGQVPVVFGPLASADGANPTFVQGTQTCSSVYCHGSTLEGGTATAPAWTASIADCTGCHGNPPPTGQHELHIGLGLDCGACHDGYTAGSANRATHVNGAREVVFAGVAITGWDCAGCHALR